MRRALHKILVLLALAWLAAAALREGALMVRRETTPLQQGLAPGQWRWGSPPVRRLAGFLERTRRQAGVPDGGRVAVAAPSPGDLFRTMWTAYLLPHQDVMSAGSRHAYTDADYWLTLARRIDHPRLALLHEERTGAIYRVLPPAGEAP